MRVQDFIDGVSEEVQRSARVFDLQNTLKYRASCQYGYVWFSFADFQEEDVVSVNVTVPEVVVEAGLSTIEINGIRRSVSPYWIEAEQRFLDYYDVMYQILCGDTEGFLPPDLVKDYSLISNVCYCISRGAAGLGVYNAQRSVNTIVQNMPVYKTDMNTYAMNRRIIIVDPNFDLLSHPHEQLEYTITKNKKYYPMYGWTSNGISDGAVVSKNYIMEQDFRQFSPFGMRHHHFKRNLYSTFGMKGTQLPKVVSSSEEKLSREGINRKGFMLNTMFVDMPGNFQDQIVLGKHLIGKLAVEDKKRYQVYGDVVVKKGDRVYKNTLLEVGVDERTLCDIDADYMEVEGVDESFANIGGKVEKVSYITIRFIRYMKGGSKITNRHGNKGTIDFADLGHVIHPKTGKKVLIDLAVSAKSVDKRGNFGQLLEAGMGFMTDSERIVISDEFEIDPEQAISSFETWGYEKGGCLTCNGASAIRGMKGVFGPVFWGCIAHSEDTVWSEEDTIAETLGGFRRKGTKLGPIEIRGLSSRFGKDSAVVKEFLSYAEGKVHFNELTRSMGSKLSNACLASIGKLVPIYNIDKLRPADTAGGFLLEKHQLEPVAAAEFFSPNGYIIQLPFQIMTVLDIEGKELYTGPPIEPEQMFDAFGDVKVVDRIYIPNSSCRMSWRHPVGRYGLGGLSNGINAMIDAYHLLKDDDQNPIRWNGMYRCIREYFDQIAVMLSGKSGLIATKCMSVRVPLSTKAVAGNDITLPRNTIILHKDAAISAGLVDGDVAILLRYPTFGFMSLRPAHVKTTEDPLYRYVIRVAGGSFGSTNLDHDGDQVHVLGVQSELAREEIRKDLEKSSGLCYKLTEELNIKYAGLPIMKGRRLDQYGLKSFGKLTIEQHQEVISKLAGVKANTGPVVAFCYSLMRLFEASEYAQNQKLNLKVEALLDKVGNSVFSQKHMGVSLHEIVTDAICELDRTTMVDNGFDPETVDVLFDVLQKTALQCGVSQDLASYHRFLKEVGSSSNIVSKCTRMNHKLYTTSRRRSTVEEILQVVDEAVVDLPSRLFDKTKTGSFSKLDYKTVREASVMRAEKAQKFKAISEVYNQLVKE